jgi:hypothetical protein
MFQILQAVVAHINLLKVLQTSQALWHTESHEESWYVMYCFVAIKVPPETLTYSTTNSRTVNLNIRLM